MARNRNVTVTKRTNSSVYTFDIKTAMRAKLQKRLKQEHVDNVSLLNEPVENIPPEVESVDKVIASMVMHMDLRKKSSKALSCDEAEWGCLIVEWNKVETEDSPPL
ncbi:class I SAM-dependent methyltransferase [Virgibacillus halophilus]|uniref:Class I SAM-dependent methyltransferase n=1 Tax=Tigheibacillus halophilus TaxID=361280 RepID=A0ABU5CDH0_9BACI|nr:class I SAM-dependent methyltransferase [Virgibacillus halophilus]